MAARKGSEGKSTTYLTADRIPSHPAKLITFAMNFGYLSFAGAQGELSSKLTDFVFGHFRNGDREISKEKSELEEDAVALEFEGDLDFRFDVTRDLVAARFSRTPKTAEALIIAKGYFGVIFDLLGDRLPAGDSNGLQFDVDHIFFLKDTNRSNRQLVSDKVVSGLGDRTSVFAPLLGSLDDLGRLDLKFLSEMLGSDMGMALSLEFPANDDYSTIWPKFQCMTGEKYPLGVKDLRAYVPSFFDAAYKAFCGPYAQFLERLLANEKLDLSRGDLRD